MFECVGARRSHLGAARVHARACGGRMPSVHAECAWRVKVCMAACLDSGLGEKTELWVALDKVEALDRHLKEEGERERGEAGGDIGRGCWGDLGDWGGGGECWRGWVFGSLVSWMLL